MDRRRKRSRRLACCLALALVAPRTFALSTLSSAPTRPQRLETAGAGAHGDQRNESALTEAQQKQDSAGVNAAREVPPWLKRLEGSQHDDATVELDWLEYALLEQQFSAVDVREILRAVQRASRGDASKLVGMIAFCRLILQLKEPMGDMFVTKDVLLASALHYADCITARETGVYEMVKEAISGGKSNVKNRPLPFQLDPNTRSYSTVMSADDLKQSSTSALSVRNADAPSAYQEYGNEVMRISKGAAQVKRAEILANAVLSVGRIPSKEEASRLRGLLLSVMDDWRSLAIRAVACLYRLEGILHDCESGASEYVELSQEIVTATREALHVYAPLAQRLGMQRLKAKLEDRSFRIMYRRQYHAVSSLYQEKGEEMKSVSSSLSAHIEQVLRQTPVLMDQLQNLRVTSRVKEPYSLWKKLLTLRARKVTSSSSPSLVGSTESSSTSSELSLLDVKDAIAVRVILTARKWSPDEPEETTRARERLLCYYVQHLLRNYWPLADKSRVKDYIQFPKPNGYQSLHYTSSIANEGLNWPFEVQVRSEEMHRIAEYGVAAHWDYKLANQKVGYLSPSFERNARSLPRLEDSIQLDEKTGDLKASVPASEKSYIDAIVTARKDLVQQKVFVFFAGSSAIDNVGQLLSLPVGAKVDDALSQLKDQLDTDIDIAASDGSVSRNGRVAKGDEYVGNGDVLLITL